jgi:hypothetical protein
MNRTGWLSLLRCRPRVQYTRASLTESCHGGKSSLPTRFPAPPQLRLPPAAREGPDTSRRDQEPRSRGSQSPHTEENLEGKEGKKNRAKARREGISLEAEGMVCVLCAG